MTNLSWEAPQETMGRTTIITQQISLMDELMIEMQGIIQLLRGVCP